MNWQEITKHNLKVYSTRWCSDCRRLKALLDGQGVEFLEIDINDDQKAMEHLVAQTGHKAIPYIEVDDKWMIRGWHKEKPSRWDDSTFFSEVEGVLKGS